MSDNLLCSFNLYFPSPQHALVLYLTFNAHGIELIFYQNPVRRPQVHENNVHLFHFFDERNVTPWTNFSNLA